MITPRENFIRALQNKIPEGRVPHFELVFYLTMETFGKVHPCHRDYSQWHQMSLKERKLHIEDMGQLYIDVAEKYEHSAIFIHSATGKDEGIIEVTNYIRENTNDKYFIMCHGDATLAIPDGEKMLELSYRIVDEPQKLHEEANKMVDDAVRRAEGLKSIGLDGFALCSDYCLNDGPFLSPGQFSEFVAPYLEKLIKAYREFGYYTIKHTDGNIMPILDQISQCKPHALHSLDPQGGVDIAKIKKMIGSQICLCGNVNCGLLDTGTDDQILESARYALENGMPNGGYIFSTSNCVYTGMDLAKYELMLDVWKKEGNDHQ